MFLTIERGLSKNYISRFTMPRKQGIGRRKGKRRVSKKERTDNQISSQAIPASKEIGPVAGSVQEPCPTNDPPNDPVDQNASGTTPKTKGDSV